MQFQHTTPMPTGISTIPLASDSSMIGVSQMKTVEGLSGETQAIIPGDIDDTLSINLTQLLVTWGNVTQIGKFEIQSKDPALVIYQDQPAGNIVLPCYDVPRFLGNFGLMVLNNSTGGEYSVTAIYRLSAQ